MDPAKNLPQMPETSRIDKLAMSAVETRFLRAAGYELEKIEGSSDYGRDMRVIFKVEGVARGYS